MPGTEVKKKKKILLIGLDNAGKTSIVKLVVKKIADAMSTVPTKGVDRSETQILGQEIMIHDLGGQKKYKQKYLENTTYFDGTDVLIYVLDLQDKDRYDMALDYFDKALFMLDQVNAKPRIFVFLHKFDGIYIEEYKDVKTRVQLECDQLKDSFEEMAKKHGIEVEDTFRTTISNELGCFEAFIHIWAAVIPKAESIQQFLDKLVADNEEIGIALLLDDKGNIIAKTLRSLEGENMEQIVGVAAKSVTLLLDWQKTIEHNKLDHDFAIIEVEDHSIMIQRVTSGKETLCMLIYAVSGKYKELQERLGKITFTLESMI